LLRDPVERVNSLYLFLRWQREQLGKAENGVRIMAKMRELGWELDDVYRELGGGGEPPPELRELFFLFFNGQAREILAPVTSDLPLAADAQQLDRFRDRALERLSSNYVVGTQDRFSQSVRLFADSFGWRRTFVPRLRVSPYGARREEVDEETRSLIRAHNRVDAELHARYSERLSALPAVSHLSQRSWQVRQRLGRPSARARESWRAVRRRLPSSAPGSGP
jgi:hypothetical protein